MTRVAEEGFRAGAVVEGFLWRAVLGWRFRAVGWAVACDVVGLATGAGVALGCLAIAVAGRWEVTPRPGSAEESFEVEEVSIESAGVLVLEEIVLFDDCEIDLEDGCLASVLLVAAAGGAGVALLVSVTATVFLLLALVLSSTIGSGLGLLSLSVLVDPPIISTASPPTPITECLFELLTETMLSVGLGGLKSGLGAFNSSSRGIYRWLNSQVAVAQSTKICFGGAGEAAPASLERGLRGESIIFAAEAAVAVR